jgi:hypothetical protein
MVRTIIIGEQRYEIDCNDWHCGKCSYCKLWLNIKGLTCCKNNNFETIHMLKYNSKANDFFRHEECLAAEKMKK